MERKRRREGDGEAHRAERREAREADLRDELLRRRLAGDVAADELAVEEVDLDERRPASAGPRLTWSEKPLGQGKREDTPRFRPCQSRWQPGRRAQ